MSRASNIIVDDDFQPDEARKNVASWYTPGLSDGLGDRLLMFDNTSGSSLELLRFKREFANRPQFEDALRRRVAQLERFTHPAVATVRTVQSLGANDGLALVSNQTIGRRLSEVVREARGHRFALELLRQIVPALAALQDFGEDVSHGIITPDRVVVTPEGRLVLIEHVLGSAVESLNIPADRLRLEFGIPVPADAGRRRRSSAGVPLDRRADVLQLGFIALSLMAGREIDPRTGLVPVTLNLEACNGCGLCFDACPEPYGLRPQPEVDFEVQDPEKLFGTRAAPPRPAPIPPQAIPLPAVTPLVVKGNYAAAIGALLAGCRHVFGYPITPSTEGAELMAKLLPKLDGIFLQAVSEVATVNMMYGCGGAGLPCMTFTSSPGFSLMVEGISYMIGAEVPGVFVNVMRGGPGLGNIAPEQADIKLACRGLGHGNTHAIVLVPSTPQEMLDLTSLAFDLSFKYRNPVVLLCDGYLGQMTGKVTLPGHAVRPGLPAWAVAGDASHRGNLVASIELKELDQEAHVRRLVEKYARIAEAAGCPVPLAAGFWHPEFSLPAPAATPIPLFRPFRCLIRRAAACPGKYR